MGFDVDLADFGRTLKTVDKAFATATRKAIRAAVNAAGQEIMGEMKSEAGWSRRIPGAIRMTVSFGAKSAGVKIVTSSARAPHGRPYEHGGNGGEFRHKVFGRDVWVSQPARPFFWPSVRHNDASTTEKLNAAIDQAIREAGFH